MYGFDNHTNYKKSTEITLTYWVANSQLVITPMGARAKFSLLLSLKIISGHSWENTYLLKKSTAFKSFRSIHIHAKGAITMLAEASIVNIQSNFIY